MADFLNRVEELIMDAVVGTATYTAETATFVQLHDGDPGEDGSANVITGVARQEVTSWTGASGSRSNGNELQFPNTTGGTINVSFFTVHDALTLGNGIMKGSLSVPQAVPDGQTGRFQIGQLTLSAD